MKGLLQSKTFRKNLSKWLLAYVGVMMLLTTVITYSRYISRYQGNDSKAEAAKFNIKIKPLECKDNYTGATCNKDAYWSTEHIYYYFLVDTTEVEVNATEYLTIRYDNKNFIFKEIDEIVNFSDPTVVNKDDVVVNLQKITPVKIDDSYITQVVLSDFSTGYRVEIKIDAKERRKKAYRIELEYIGKKPEDVTSSDFAPSYDFANILTLDYSAIQTK